MIGKCGYSNVLWEHKQNFFLVSRGGFGLWLDADLYHGSSFSCPTFHNASLSTQEDFIVQDLEVWTVQN